MRTATPHAALLQAASPSCASFRIQRPSVRPFHLHRQKAMAELVMDVPSMDLENKFVEHEAAVESVDKLRKNNAVDLRSMLAELKNAEFDMDGVQSPQVSSHVWWGRGCMVESTSEPKISFSVWHSFRCRSEPQLSSTCEHDLQVIHMRFPAH